MPAALRSARISNSASVRANARTATAVAENDTRAPAIQRTTVRTLRCVTSFIAADGSVVRLNESRASREADSRA